MENYVKIEVYNTEKNCTEFWYLDISNLNLTDIIKLKKEILGKSEHLETVLTKIIARESISGYETDKTNRRKSQKLKQPIRNKKRVLNKKRGRY